MKMLSPRLYSLYSAVLKLLRERGDRPGLLQMQTACDLVIAIEAGDEAEAKTLAERLNVDLEALGGG